MTLRSDLQQVAKDALGEREGSVVVHRPDDRRGQGDVELPDVRPQPGRHPTTSTQARDVINVAPGRARRAAAGQRVPAALHAGFDVQGPDHGHRAGDGRDRPVDARSPTSARGCRRRPTTRSRTSRASSAAATCTEVFTPQLQHPVRPDGARHRRRADGPGRRRLGRRRADPDRPAPPGGQHVRRRRGPRPEPPAAGDPRLRPERRPDGAAAHGDGRRDGRQRRADDEAVRRRPDAGPRRPRRSTTTQPEVWKTPITPATADDPDAR